LSYLWSLPLKCSLLRLSKDPVVVGLVERSLVVGVVRVSPGVVPRSFVGSDGIPKARKIGDDKDLVTSLFNVCSFWEVGFEDDLLLVRGGSSGVRPALFLRGLVTGWVVWLGILSDNRQ
jgi:hypothetical protein